MMEEIEYNRLITKAKELKGSVEALISLIEFTRRCWETNEEELKRQGIYHIEHTIRRFKERSKEIEEQYNKWRKYIQKGGEQ